MDTTFIWEIKAKNPPLLIKECNYCDSDRLYCSDKFRMNAQKKNIDVWPTYRRAKCDNTYNTTLPSRTKPDSIDKVLFHSFSMNDRKTAWKYTSSAKLTGRSHLKTDYDSAEYEVMDNFSKEDIIRMSDATTKIQIKRESEFNLELSSLLRRNFLLPSTQLRRLSEQGVISFPSGEEPQKCKVKNGDILLIDREHLSVMMDFVDSFMVKIGID